MSNLFRCYFQTRSKSSKITFRLLNSFFLFLRILCIIWSFFLNGWQPYIKIPSTGGFIIVNYPLSFLLSLFLAYKIEFNFSLLFKNKFAKFMPLIDHRHHSALKYKNIYLQKYMYIYMCVFLLLLKKHLNKVMFTQKQKQLCTQQLSTAADPLHAFIHFQWNKRQTLWWIPNSKRTLAISACLAYGAAHTAEIGMICWINKQPLTHPSTCVAMKTHQNTKETTLLRHKYSFNKKNRKPTNLSKHKAITTTPPNGR